MTVTRDDDHDQESRDGGSRHCREGQSEGKGIGHARIKHDDGAERRGLRRPEDRRLAERIAQQSLNGRAAKSERAADRERQQEPRQPDLAHDESGTSLPGNEAVQDIPRRQRRGTDEQGHQRKADEEEQQKDDQQRRPRPRAAVALGERWPARVGYHVTFTPP